MVVLVKLVGEAADTVADIVVVFVEEVDEEETEVDTAVFSVP